MAQAFLDRKSAIDHTPHYRMPHSQRRSDNYVHQNPSEDNPPPTTFAFPVRQKRSQSTTSNHLLNDLVTEHTLRRKTPNGTLAAGYDATPVDRVGQGPAAKHVVVSSLPGTSTSQHGPTFFAGQDLSTSTNRIDSMFAYHSDGPYRQEYVTDKSGHGYQTESSFAARKAPHQHPSMDSVLDQTLPMQVPSLYLQPGSNIPTVHPGNFQHYAPPTASIGSEVYGPYWPDGAFIPYRPAPIRDPRFVSHVGPAFHPRASHEFHSNTPFQPHRLSSDQYRQIGAGYTPPVNEISHILPSPYGVHYSSVGGAGEHMVNLPYPSQQYQDSNTRTETGTNLHWNFSRPLDSRQMKAAKQSGNAQFKDRIFEWAHAVYVDLLASIQRKQRSNPLKPDGQGRRSSKPSIYPKPPRQPGFEPLPPTSDKRRPHSNSFHGYYSQYNYSPREDHRNSMNLPHQQYPQRSHPSPWSSGASHNSFSEHNSDYAPSPHGYDSKLSSSMFSPPPNHSALESKAAEALDMLENLCRESQERWVDGMLLAGCLAHGIADYEKALYWYQRVLDRDSSHVEALSNLAASLAMLNRKDEAERWWMAAVKLRPSHFEAVEHLINLLCSSHRGKEALHIIEFVESELKLGRRPNYVRHLDPNSEIESEAESISTTESMENPTFESDGVDGNVSWDDFSPDRELPGYGSSGYKIPGSENGRMLALIHAKANMLFSLRDFHGTASAFEEAVLIATGRHTNGVKGLISRIQKVLVDDINAAMPPAWHQSHRNPILLLPDKAIQTSRLMFHGGELPGVQYVSAGKSRAAAISTTSNALLCLAKIYQDSMSHTGLSGGGKALDGVRDVLALYYLSLSLHPSASTANNIGLLLTGVQHLLPPNPGLVATPNVIPDIGIVPGSPTAVALAFYNYGLFLDNRHSHLYTNLGSLLKDVGQVSAAVQMYQRAVDCEGDFDIALANLANALKDQGRMADAIKYYQRAVQANPDFAEAVCGLSTSLNSVCSWKGRGGIYGDHGIRDRWHVDDTGMLVDARASKVGSAGWMKNVIDTVEKQLRNAQSWGQGTLTGQTIDLLIHQIVGTGAHTRRTANLATSLENALTSWTGQSWEGSRIVKLVERAGRALVWQWYQDRYVNYKEYPLDRYRRPSLPSSLTTPMTPTVLPFHAFTTPLSAKQVRMISQQNGLRMSVSTLRSSWLPQTVFPPPPPPSPYLRVGYVSSDFNNHPLAHLMQNVFGFHNPSRVRAYCYATTPSDGSIHRKKIEEDAPIFYDASAWPLEKLVNQIVQDQIHILINLNGYTRGARNEIFAARPAPISMSFMGFAGSLGAEWCDYLLSDSICVPPSTLSPSRQNVTIEDRLHPSANAEDSEDWVYSENIIFTRASFFCCDHKQSGPDFDRPNLTWPEELHRRSKMRAEIFPNLSPDAVIFGNFNQLYKIDPTTFRTWLRILSQVPNSILWLLRFPDLGEQHLLNTARKWAGESVASRVIFTDVANKSTHISRARVVDLFLDTPECNAHTTSADVVWSGTPVLTFGRRPYKMCSRMAGSIISSALPEGPEGDEARRELVVNSEEEYEETAIRLARSLKQPTIITPSPSPPTSSSSSSSALSTPSSSPPNKLQKRSHPKSSITSSTQRNQTLPTPVATTTITTGGGSIQQQQQTTNPRLLHLRSLLWHHRWSSRLFDTKRWVRDLESGYEEAWRRWVRGEGGDIWL